MYVIKPPLCFCGLSPVPASVRWAEGLRGARSTRGFGAFTASELRSEGPGLRSWLVNSWEPLPEGTHADFCDLVGGVVGCARTCGRGPALRGVLGTRPGFLREGPPGRTLVVLRTPLLVPAPPMKGKASGGTVIPHKIDDVVSTQWLL